MAPRHESKQSNPIDRPTDRPTSRSIESDPNPTQHKRINKRTCPSAYRLWPVSRFSMTVEKTMRPKGSKASRSAADCVRKERLPTKSL